MKIYINGILYDAEKTPIIMLFDDNDQLHDTISDLNTMTINRDIKYQPRIYATFPVKMVEFIKERVMREAKGAWHSWYDGKKQEKH